MRSENKSFFRKSRLYLLGFIGFIATTIGCATNLPQENKKESFSDNNYQDTILNQFAKPYINKHQNQTGFYPLGDGQAALIARLSLIEMTQKNLDVQYYLYGDDETSRLMTWYLYQAAERGVRVRLLLDDMQGRDDAILASLSAHPNIEIRLFNPFLNRSIKFLGFLYDFSRLNSRMHNKSITADGTFSIVGGRNIGDEYFSANAEVDFGDFDLLLVGDVVPKVLTQFDSYWNHVSSIPIENFVKEITPITKTQLETWRTAQTKYLINSEYAASLRNHPLVEELASNSLAFYWSNATLNYDNPDKVLGGSDGLLIDDLTSAIEKAEKEFILVSPYFVPTKKGAQLLAKKAQSGISVTVITNSLASNDVFAVHGWYSKYRKILLEGGVKLYETKIEPDTKIKRSFISRGKSSLHAKSFIVDANKVFVGSFNFDPRSMYINTEMGIFVDSPEFVELFNENLDVLLNKTSYNLTLDSKNNIQWNDYTLNKTYDSEPDSSIWLRMGAWFAGVLPIESQL